MRYSQLFPKTIKEDPKDEASVNARYLLRGGFIDKLMAGSYTLLPLGRLVQRKIEQIVREEMNATGAQEILMPLLHPKEIWNETGRWDSAAEVMYKLKKEEKEYALSFTHEEIVMDVIRKHLTSYKDLPIILYHFSTKFRDELRAKSGLLRGREFIMKDMYSAHPTEESMWDYYWKAAEAYKKTYKRLGLEAIVAEAAGGVFTDSHTHEFQIESSVGEDTIYMADGWEMAKNEEVMTDDDRKAPGLRTITTIEAGNIFPFGTEKYADKMGGFYMDQDGSKKPVWFASYGIGITRMMGILAEVFHDNRGIIWPESVAPYQVHLVGILNQESGIRDKAEALYNQLQDSGIEVLFDDREDAGAGQKFADADLLGIPVRLVVSAKTLSTSSGHAGDRIEWKMRKEEKSELLTADEVLKRIVH
jgi:prolyl-tRNA synthetase